MENDKSKTSSDGLKNDDISDSEDDKLLRPSKAGSGCESLKKSGLNPPKTDENGDLSYNRAVNRSHVPDISSRNFYRSNRTTNQSTQDREELARQEEASRIFREITSDPDMMDQALRAAVNPNVARELARQADTAWRNIEALPGGFRALCQMHHNIQQPLWQAVIGSDSSNVHYNKNTSTCPTTSFNEPLSIKPMPNPWKSESKSANDLASRHYANSYPMDGFGSFSYNNALGDFNFNYNTDQCQTAFCDPQCVEPTVQSTQNKQVQDTPNVDDDPSEKYAKEIAELEGMGLNDKYKCLTALEAADGDLFQALGILQSLEELENEENNN